MGVKSCHKLNHEKYPQTQWKTLLHPNQTPGSEEMLNGWGNRVGSLTT